MSLFAAAIVLQILGSGLATSDKLVHVNVVFSNGYTSPPKVFPTDENSPDTWPQGLGWLTEVGAKQSHQVGSWLHDRYIKNGFMKTSYDHNEIEVLSSAKEKAILSAYSTLAGLYPIDANLPWQQTPVQVIPKEKDNILHVCKYTCPKLKAFLGELRESKEVKHIEEKYKSFFPFLANKTGYEYVCWKKAMCIEKTLFLEKMNNRPLPSWANQTVVAQLEDIASLKRSPAFWSKDRSRLQGGPLVGRMISNMQAAVNGSNNATKMNMYSGHCSTLLGVLSAMDISNNELVDMGSVVILELHKKKSGDFKVEIILKTDKQPPKTLNIPKCNGTCSLQQFIELTKCRIPEDWNKECRLGEHDDELSGDFYYIIAVTVLGVLLLICMILLGVSLTRKKGEENQTLVKSMNS